MNRHLAIALLVVLGLSGLRLIHLAADTPTNLALDSVGVYVDEGYKTLDARNMSLYGSPRWHPDDEFAGWWLEHSPLPTSLFFLAFRAFGDSLESARVVTIVWFAVFLLGYVYATWRDYTPTLFYVGLVLLALVHLVFFLSRLALHVQPIATSLYWSLFLLRRRVQRPAFVALLICGFLLLTTLLIKESAVLHFPPLLIGSAAAWMIGSRPNARQIAVAGVLVAAASGLAAWVTRDIWQPLLSELALPTAFRDAVFYPLTDSAALLVAAGLVVSVHWLASQNREFWTSVYRSSLVSLVILGPPTLWILPYQPTRYYIPLLPAFLLIVLEWLHLRSWRTPLRPKLSVLLTAGCIGILLWSALCLGRAANRHVLASLDLSMELGKTGRFLFPEAEIALGLAAIVLWRLRRRLLTPRIVLGFVLAVVTLSVSRDLYLVGGFLVRPSHDSRQIAAAMDEIVPTGGSIGGDWAPFFALGTDMKALRMSGGFNYPANVPVRALRPDYYLFSDTDSGHYVKQMLDAEEGVTLQPPTLHAEYLGLGMRLYPLSYAGE